MPSPEMLKQLLDEFTQKQSSTQEDIKKTEQQLQELESQIDSCRNKLKFIAQDRLKVIELMQHWSSNGVSVSSPAKAPEPADQPDQPSTFAKVAGLRKELRKTTPAQTPPAAQAPPPPPPPAPEPPSEQPQEPDDAVKSINDALRGLFS